MKLTLMKWSGSWTCCTRSDGLIMSRIGELRSWKSVSCLRVPNFWRAIRKSAVRRSIVVSISVRRALIWLISASTWLWSRLSSASRSVRSSSSLVSLSSDFLALTAALGLLARASSYRYRSASKEALVNLYCWSAA